MYSVIEKQYILLSLLTFPGIYYNLNILNFIKYGLTMDKYQFGEKIRRIRERKKISLKQAAAGIQVSDSLLSQIERNKVSPSIDTLLAIADYLEIDLDYLFRDFRQKREIDVVKNKSRSTLKIDNVFYQKLSKSVYPGEAYDFESILIDIAPGQEKGTDEFGHIGKEVGFILKGNAEFSYGSQVYILEEGDSISFSSDIPHKLVNTGDGPLQAIWIISPPRIFSNRE